MRLYRIGEDDIHATMLEPAARELDGRGNARLAGQTGDGRPILVVVVGDDPDTRTGATRFILERSSRLLEADRSKFSSSTRSWGSLSR